jgi:hypothetical protein
VTVEWGSGGHLRPFPLPLIPRDRRRPDGGTVERDGRGLGAEQGQDGLRRRVYVAIAPQRQMRLAYGFGRPAQQVVHLLAGVGGVLALPGCAALEPGANDPLLAVQQDQMAGRVLSTGEVSVGLAIPVAKIGAVEDDGVARCQPAADEAITGVMDKLVLLLAVGGARDEDPPDTIGAHDRDRRLGRQFAGEVALARAR